MNESVEIGHDWLVEEVRNIRRKLRYPFADGQGEEELVAATLDRVRRLGHLFARKDRAWWNDWVRSQLRQVARDRDEAAAAKYSNLFFKEAKRLCADLGLPQTRLDFTDLAQDAMARALEKHDMFRRDFEGEFVNALKSLIGNHARNLKAHHLAGIRDQQRESANSPDVTSPLNEANWFDSQQTTVSEDYRRRIFLESMSKALQALHGRELSALRLFYRKKTMKEIDEELGVSRKETMMLITSASSKIQQHVGSAADGVKLDRFTVRQFVKEFFQDEEPRVG